MYTAIFLLSVFAIPGIYYLLCVMLSSFFNRRAYSLLIHGDGLSHAEILLEVRAATVYTEGKRGFHAMPMVLFSELPDRETEIFLSEYGIPSCYYSGKQRELKKEAYK